MCLRDAGDSGRLTRRLRIFAASRARLAVGPGEMIRVMAVAGEGRWRCPKGCEAFDSRNYSRIEMILEILVD